MHHFRYDGTTASGLPWSAGTQPSWKKLVRLFDDTGDDNDGYTVEATTPPTDRLICKKPAAYRLYYDACTKFKTCT